MIGFIFSHCILQPSPISHQLHRFASYFDRNNPQIHPLDWLNTTLSYGQPVQTERNGEIFYQFWSWIQVFSRCEMTTKENLLLQCNHYPCLLDQHWNKRGIFYTQCQFALSFRLSQSFSMKILWYTFQVRPLYHALDRRLWTTVGFVCSFFLLT